MIRNSLNVLVVIVAMVGFSAQAAKEVARVNGTVITDTDVKNALSGFNEGQRASILRDGNSKVQIVRNLVDQELLFQQAQKANLDKSKEYKKALEAFRKQYLANLIVERELGPKMTNNSAKQYFKRNRNKFSTSQIRAQHILLKSEKQAREMLKRSRQKGADFQELAEKFSIDPSAKHNRGDLGYFTRDRMVPEFTDVAFRTDVGQVAGPIKTAYGYHVIKVTDRRPGKTLEYDEVELQVKAALRQNLVSGYVRKLRKGAKISIKK